jgi:hypothetical protein
MELGVASEYPVSFTQTGQLEVVSAIIDFTAASASLISPRAKSFGTEMQR